MRPVLALAAPLFLALTATAQTPAAPDAGSVTGHILCGDTQRPARLAEVRLVPTSITAAAKPNYFEDLAVLGNNIPPVQTDMSGEYTVRNVRPGTYYLRVDYTGYLTPILGFTRDQLAHPTPEIQQRVATQLQVIPVAPHAATRADVTIARGAAIFGTITYDDGSPAVGLGLALYQRDAKGEFKTEFPVAGLGSSTDGHGHYRFDSLPSDSFVVAANFSINELTVTTLPNLVGAGTMQMNLQKVIFSLPLYSGSALRLHDAIVIKTDQGQDAPSTDLVLPLSKLHRVSGTVTTKGGHTVSSGKVALLYADTREELTNVPISREDGRFNFLYVPEGDYILAVQKAEDVVQIEIPNPPGSTPKNRLEDKTTHTYGTAEQPIKVEGELPSILAIVPEKAVAATPQRSDEVR
jgi:hypothetical protein